MSALKQLTPTSVYVGGIKYHIRPFPAFKAANISGELANMLLPFFGAVAGAIDTNEEGKDISLTDIDVGTAVEAISRTVSLNGGDVEGMMRKLLLGGHISVRDISDDSGQVVDTQPLTEDLANELFCGELQDMYKLCYEVIKVNFNGFFMKLAALSGKVGSAEIAMQHTIL